MAALHGKNAAIYIDSVKVTQKTEWALTMNRDYADVTTFRDGHKVYAAGLRDLAGTFSGLLDVAGDLTLSSSDGDTHVIALYAEDGVTLIATGPAYLDASVAASSTDAIRCSGNFRAAGAWTIS